MKKFLFTLAALLSLGFAAQADNMYPGQYLNDGPTIVYGDIDGNEITEVTVTPGGDGVELSLILKQMNCTMISGFGAQWRMYDASHNGINYATTAMVQCAKVYGTRTKFWFNPVGIGTNDPDQGGYNGVSLANSTPYDNVYRILATNTVENMIFFVEDLDGNPTCPAVFGNFTVKATDAWEEDFATFELDQEYSLFNQCPDYDPNDYWEARCADPQVLTIKNANATPAPTKVADPVVSFVENGDVLTVTMTCETEGAHIWVDGVDMGEAPYTYTVNRTYEAQVISGTAVGKKDNMEDSEEVPFSYTFAAKEKNNATAPVITYEVTDDAVVVTVTPDPNTDGDLVYDGQYSYPRLDADYTVTVNAYTTAGDTYNASTTTTVEITIPAYVPPTPVETTTYVKVTSNDQLVAGKHYILVAGEYAMGEITANSTAAGVAVTLNGDECEAPETVTVLTLGEKFTQFSQDYWPVQLADGQYLAVAGTNKFKFVADASSTYNMWKISATYTIADGDYGYPVKKGRTNLFGPTSSTSEMTPAVLYVEKTDTPPTPVDEVADPVITFTENGDVLTVTVSCETEGATLFVNGEEVNNPYTYTVDRTYEAQTIEVEAYAVNGTATSETVSDSYTFAAKPYETLQGTLTIGEVNQENGQFVVTYNGDENVTITCDMTPVTSKATDKTFTLPGYGTYTVNAKATAVDPEYNGDYVEATATLTWRQPQTATPTITVTETEEGYLVTATGEGTVTLYVEDIQVAQGEGSASYTIPYNPEGEEYGVSATAQNPGEAVSEYALETVQDPGQTAKPTITYTDDPENHVVHVTANGDGVVTLYVEDVQVAQGNGSASYDLPYTEDEYGEEVGVSATAKEEGLRVSDYAVETIEVPGTEPVTPPVTEVGEPTFTGYTIDGITGYGVYIFPSTPADADIMYRVFTWNPETEAYDIPVTDGWQEYTGAEGEIYYTDMGGKYRVEAYAYVGDVQSEQIGYEFVVHVPTALDEMMGGKTVAGVRYYNMAGQEMQEANGVTIVVTTYTDGTTSAVKVLK